MQVCTVKTRWAPPKSLVFSIEEAVNEVKRQAMEEVQKAVAEAEQKAFEMIAAERAKMEKTVAEAKRKAQEDAIMVINEQEDSSEVSKNCRETTATRCVCVYICVCTYMCVLYVCMYACMHALKLPSMHNLELQSFGHF